MLQCETNSDQQARLTARWTVIDRSKTILISQISQLHRRAGSHATEDSVTALSETLDDLSREIIESLQAFEKQGKT